jgi:hypothetical protein
MTFKQQYAGYFVAKNKIEDILSADLYARIGAPGTPKEWFIEQGCLLTDEGRAKLGRIQHHIRRELQTLFPQVQKEAETEDFRCSVAGDESYILRRLNYNSWYIRNVRTNVTVWEGSDLVTTDEAITAAEYEGFEFPKLP